MPSNSKIENLSNEKQPVEAFNVKNVKSDDDENNGNKIVRYVNSAAWIEKEIEHSNKEIEYGDFQNESSRSSTISNDKILDRQYQSHIIVGNDLHIPALELNSNESYPSSDDISYSYSRIKEAVKIIQKPDAYKEWIKAKQTIKKVKDNHIKEVETKKDMEKLERKEAAEKKFREWLINKQKQKDVKNNAKSKTETNCEQLKINHNDHPTSEERERCFQLWLKNKRNKEKVIKEDWKKKLLREEEEKYERKKKAEILYDEWLKTLPFKPKPVPLNKGLLTLKGTISNLYFNPEPWHMTTAETKNTHSL